MWQMDKYLGWFWHEKYSLFSKSILLLLCAICIIPDNILQWFQCNNFLKCRNNCWNNTSTLQIMFKILIRFQLACALRTTNCHLLRLSGGKLHIVVIIGDHPCTAWITFARKISLFPWDNKPVSHHYISVGYRWGSSRNSLAWYEMRDALFFAD